MPSGGRRMVINTQERAVSTDINRLQYFVGKDRSELWRYLIDVSAGTDDLDAAALDTEYATQENPLRGEIINGLLVQPQGGSLNLLVTAGTAMVMDPDAAPSTDDSAYKLVRDAGVQTLGALAMTGNASGFTRIDVIECQRTEVTVETDNRDIFNPVSQLFVATTVTKGLQSEFTYRVRAGTPNAGFPGTAQGWLPLAVVSVPNGATSCDQMTFWDVRPLINDRILGPFNISRSRPVERRVFGTALVSGANLFLSGVFEHEIGARRVGGQMRPGTPQTDAAKIDLKAAVNQDPTSVFSGTMMWFVYYVTPFGLPRWARYTDGPAGRVPRSPRGIPVVSAIGPNEDGSPSAGITLPTATGLGTTVQTSAICFAAGLINAGTWIGMGYDGRVQTLAMQSPPNVGAPATLGNSAAIWNLDNTIYNKYFPANARALHVKFNVTDALLAANSNTVTNAYDIQVFMQDVVAGMEVFVQGPQFKMSNASAVGINPQWGVAARVVVPFSDYPSKIPVTRPIGIFWTNGIGTATAATLAIQGWEMGP